ncbi:S26 family signal peptidase [Halopiger goleimassiliensis]|uniref:S26 family signal peptidase n=1 Tax=Halopiger goleimassiliensis TaxID=1293048 RepID=UPI0009DBD1CD|nr:S26 family signal peptidase [Halopiger goleimassiliensis]
MTGVGSDPDGSDRSTTARGDVSGQTTTTEHGDAEDDDPSLVRDVLTVLAIVAAVFFLLVGVSGVWPPLVAVESGSMEPNVRIGDLVYVVDDDRFVGGESAADTGVVPLEAARNDHEQFGAPGDVIVFAPNGDRSETPVIHRAHYWVEDGENWVETKADARYVNGYDCHELVSCPAPHDGFITKGDANPGYDQIGGVGAHTTVVAPEWISAKASFRVPWLGKVRLAVESLLGLAVPIRPARHATRRLASGDPGPRAES